MDNDDRFEFGENWTQFLRVVDEGRIFEAKQSLQQLLQMEELRGRRFLDAGSGSGLLSLAARQLGAVVHSFDVDLRSVACTRELRGRYCEHDADWWVVEGSVLDRAFLAALGQYDIVYSWGVLHHTGGMWDALDNLTPLVKSDGYLCIAIYNDQGVRSHLWRGIKRLYNRLPALLRVPYTMLVMSPFALRTLLWDLIRLRPHRYLERWTRYGGGRGMSYWHDFVDWVGGYPFEVATPELVQEFCRARGFELIRLSTVSGGWGCNEFVFRCQRGSLDGEGG